MDSDIIPLKNHFPNSYRRTGQKEQVLTPRELKLQLEKELNEQVHRILSQQFPNLSLPTKPVRQTVIKLSAFNKERNNLINQFKKSEYENSCSVNVIPEGTINDLKPDKIKKTVTFSNEGNSPGKEHIINSFTFLDFEKKHFKIPNTEVKFKTRKYYAEMMQLANNEFGMMSKSEKKSYYYVHTVQGFTESLTLGKLPDGTNLHEVEPGKFVDHFGFVRWMNGPFWPSDYGPLHPAPILKHSNSSNFMEPLLHEDHLCEDEKMKTKPPSIFDRKWVESKVVYNAETFAKNYQAIPQGPNFCPSLEFESRFESGNLFSANQVGQTDYELVLRTDLNTSGHTQWFYFRMKNMIKGLRYHFKIVNLTKKSNLYLQGMQPLLYSEYLATTEEIYWHRCGFGMKYSTTHQKSYYKAMDKNQTYYSLQWFMEFPQDNDTCYMAHCYPYTYSDLQVDLTSMMKTSYKLARLDSLCVTRAGNTCFLVTIDDPEFVSSDRRIIVFSARIHPGETNSSFVMKGLLEFLTGSSEFAQELRKNFIFKIIPMLNPDGVIVGNYRCSLVGRDLNRNFIKPNKTFFPTVYHLKQLISTFQERIILYCDLHGHNQKQNVFMYGCPPNTSPNDFKPGDYLKTRIIPWLMSKQSPDKFVFDGCCFHVSKSKESTARVVMFRQFNIINSFTLEATFCGTTVLRHQFNREDFEDVGRSLCQVLSQYHRLTLDKELRTIEIIPIAKSSYYFSAISFRYESKIIHNLAHEFQNKILKTNAVTINATRSKPLGITQEENCDKVKKTDLLKIVQHISAIDAAKGLEHETDSDTESEPEDYEACQSKANKRSMSYPSTQKKKLDVLPKINIKLKGPNSSTQDSNYIDARHNKPRKKRGQRSAENKSIHKYKDRSNGGIPCFTQERLLERARKVLDPIPSPNQSTYCDIAIKIWSLVIYFPEN